MTRLTCSARSCLSALFLFTLSFLALSPGILEAGQMPYLDKPKVRLSVAPGQQEYGVLVMENPTADTRNVKVYLEDWNYTPAKDGSKEFAPAGSSARSCAPWVTYSPAEFILPPFGRQRINYSVKVPPDAKGSYWMILFFETAVAQFSPQAEASGQSAGINLLVRVGTTFFVEVQGSIERSAEISGLSLKKHEPEGLDIEMDLTNSGNADITASGTYHIIDKSGKVFARGKFDKVSTLPSDKVKIRSGWKEKIPPGYYDMVFTFDLGKGLEETSSGRGPILTKEYAVEIDAAGNASKITEAAKK